MIPDEPEPESAIQRLLAFLSIRRTSILITFLTLSLSSFPSINHAGIISDSYSGASTVTYNLGSASANGLGINNVHCTTVASGFQSPCIGTGNLVPIAGQSESNRFNFVEQFKLDPPLPGANQYNYFGSSSSSFTYVPESSATTLFPSLPFLPGVNSMQLHADEFSGSGNFLGLPVNQSISTAIHTSFLVDDDGLAESSLSNDFRLFFTNITDLAFSSSYSIRYLPMGGTETVVASTSNSLTLEFLQGNGQLFSQGTIAGPIIEISGEGTGTEIEFDDTLIPVSNLLATVDIDAIAPNSIVTIDAVIDLSCENRTNALQSNYRPRFACGVSDNAFSSVSTIPLPLPVYLFGAGTLLLMGVMRRH